MMHISIHERFWTKIEKLDGGCWGWKGWISNTGYGGFQVNGKSVLAHRFAYEEVKGKIPVGLEIDHLCRVRSCVNPAHLEAVTRKVNAERAFEVAGIKGPPGVNARKTHCINGHEFNIENTYPTERHRRTCRQCHCMHMRNFRARRKEEAGNE